jgi:hypothetical protein
MNPVKPVPHVPSKRGLGRSCPVLGARGGGGGEDFSVRGKIVMVGFLEDPGFR